MALFFRGGSQRGKADAGAASRFGITGGAAAIATGVISHSSGWARSAEAAPVKAVTEIASLPRGSESVLLVEDDSQVRQSVAGQLRRQGYRVVEAAYGAMALATLESMWSPVAVFGDGGVMSLINGGS